ncbi:MAG: hypothetical protein HY744_12040 [Deltaproteobacteria bacterium]|nr:hypothetical protein [Deltaproteobacteria bacterium]
MKPAAHTALGFLALAVALAAVPAGGCGGPDAGAVGAGGGPCAPGLAPCDGQCTAVNVDPDNCGQCGRQCQAGEICSAGTCVVHCGGGATHCKGKCIDTQSDPANCGGCGNACGSGLVCSAGQCSTDCLGGTTRCGDRCVDGDTDPANCGLCGNACAKGEICWAGQCGVSCGPGTTKCAEQCVNTAIHPAHCGMCDNACGSGQICFAGQCGLKCYGGTTKCTDWCMDTEIDPAHCGSCGNACAGGQICSGGNCALQCGGGATKCGSKCVDVLLDAANCGSCGNACAGGLVCSSGVCALVCDGGTTKCGGKCVDTALDPANCGGCGKPCAQGEVCKGGKCFVDQESCTDGVDDNYDGLVDCADPLCSGYYCVAPVPNGWSGPAKLYVGGGPAPACGGPWPGSTAGGEGALSAPAATCAACGCGAPSGMSCGVGSTALWNSHTCDNLLGTVTPPAPNVCKGFSVGALDSAMGNKATTLGGSCQPAGGEATAAPATFANQALLCTGASTGAGCGSNVCAPKPGQSYATCVHKSGDVACPGSPYTVKYVIYESVSDTRACTACTCAAPVGAACPGGTTILYNDNLCQFSPVTIPNDGVSCVDTGGTKKSLIFIPGGQPPQGGACAPSGGGQPTGSVTPAGARTVCCL